MRPLRLPPNPIHHFYVGGPAIEAFRGLPHTDGHAPEDWVGSTVTRFGHDRAGLSRLEDGRLVRDALAADPEAFLGAEHVARHGADPALLVKLLDAGQRLPVHAHPDRAFARGHLACPYGKTEAWVITATRGGEPTVHLGFTRDVGAEELAGWVRHQDAAAMLRAMHALPVAAGDTVLVPAGLPHAIGEGILLVELQEPTDLSVLLEWEGFEVDGRADGHLGIGLDLALEAVNRSGLTVDDVLALAAGRDQKAEINGQEFLLPPAADPYFRAERVRPDPASAQPLWMSAGFAILVVTAGRGKLVTQAGGAHPLRRGDTLLVPYAAGWSEIHGDIEVLRCRPPRPDKELRR